MGKIIQTVSEEVLGKEGVLIEVALKKRVQRFDF